MELFGDICGLEDVDVPKEGLVVAEGGYACHTPILGGGTI
jgi:hypothetical protein